jgi:Alcohol dehydrogenase GroES-like domain/Alcohol dehydrogenase GroES-associated
MKAVTWHGIEDVRVDDVPDPTIEEPTDAIVRVTSTAICGSDLHLYKLMSPYLDVGDVLGHEPMGIVEEVGAAVTQIAPGDRVVVPFNIACGHCFMCDRDLYSQCETTQVEESGKGAALFGYTKLYGQVPGGQAEYLRVPHAHLGPVKVPEGASDERFLLLQRCSRQPGRQFPTPTRRGTAPSSSTGSGVQTMQRNPSSFGSNVQPRPRGIVPARASMGWGSRSATFTEPIAAGMLQARLEASAWALLASRAVASTCERPSSNDQQRAEGEKGEIPGSLIAVLADVVDRENVMVDDAFREVEETPASEHPA